MSFEMLTFAMEEPVFPAKGRQNQKHFTMKKLRTIIAAVLVILAAGCSKEYDDSAINKRIDNLESRVSALETLCKQMNTNISSLQTIVDALQNADYITSVTPVTQNGVTIGYTITFAKNGSATIYHGTNGKDGQDGKDGTDGKNGADGKDGVDGKDGYTPVIGIRQDADGLYYWTLDGEWLLDASGNKICAVGRDGRDGVNGQDGKDGADGRDGVDGKDGKDGNDGITPQLKIEDGYWYISYDNGITWTQLGKATGEDGKDGTNGKDGADGQDGNDGQGGANGDSMFRDVTQDELNVYLTLADGTVITIPKGAPLSIAFDEADLVVMAPNSTREIHYTVSSVIPDVEVEVVSSADIKAKVVAASATTGTIEVKTGATIDEYSKVVVFVSNGEKVIMRRFVFEQTGLQVEDNATKEAAAEGGELVLEFLSNVECEVVIPESAQSWISVVPQTRAMEKRSITLKLEPNEGYNRNATVTIQSRDGSIKLEYFVEQEGELGVDIDPEAVPEDEIWYVTDNNSICDVFIYNNLPFDRQIISNTYENGKGIIKFDGPVTTIMYRAFYDWSITELYLPDSIEYIGDEGIYLAQLYTLRIPKNLKHIGVLGIQTSHQFKSFTGYHVSEDGRCIIIDDILYAFANNFGLTEYRIPEIKEIAPYVFYRCDFLEYIYLPEGLQKIGNEAFGWCTGLKQINLPNSLESLGYYAFLNCWSIEGFYGNEKFHSPDNRCLLNYNDSNQCYIVAFAGKGVTNYTIPEGIDGIDNYGFDAAESLQTITLPNSIKWIASEAFYHCTELEYIYGPFTSADHKCIVTDNTLESFVCRKGLTEYSVPDNITHIASRAFSACELTSIYMGDQVQEIDAYAFAFCYELKSLTLSASLGGFTGNNIFLPIGLEKIYCRAPMPPKMPYDAYTTEFDNLTIYVPEQTVNLYLMSKNWEPYNKYIKGYQYDNLDISKYWPDYYYSTDYSQDGKVVTLQKATKGNGIDVVLMGDAYSDRQIADGTYMKAMQTMADNLFSEEPYKSFKEMFNVYVVNVVSATEGYEYGNTALSGFFGGGTYVGGNDNLCFEYALNAISEERMDEALIVVAMNKDAYAGTCFMYYPSNANGTYYGSGPSVAYFPTSSDTATLTGLVLHEACGHGFSKLADEYDYGTTVSADVVYSTKAQQNNWGWWKNVDFTGDPSAVRWNYFLNDYRYANDGLGVFEGGLTHSFGVWRPTENSIMRYNYGGFNAPSREAIYYRIHKLAYGDSWQYDYEEFVRYDEINRKAAASARVYAPATYKPTHPPVVVNKSWRDAK